MDLRVRKLLTDIVLSISQIETFLEENNGFVDFENNSILQNAVERQLIIIGEAINQLMKEQNPPSLSYFKQIIGLRNRLVHSYDQIDIVMIWTIIIKHLPLLRMEANHYLKM